MAISIHALTRSATDVLKCITSSLAFQSTHSQGVRLVKEIYSLYLSDFNPRTHKECDYIQLWVSFSNNLISIHALTRSATKKNLKRRFHQTFQSTHSQGVRHHKFAQECLISVFQSTHSQGVRRNC